MATTLARLLKLLGGRAIAGSPVMQGMEALKGVMGAGAAPAPAGVPPDALAAINGGAAGVQPMPTPEVQAQVGPGQGQPSAAGLALSHLFKTVTGGDSTATGDRLMDDENRARMHALATMFGPRSIFGAAASYGDTRDTLGEQYKERELTGSWRDYVQDRLGTLDQSTAPEDVEQATRLRALAAGVRLPRGPAASKPRIETNYPINENQVQPHMIDPVTGQPTPLPGSVPVPRWKPGSATVKTPSLAQASEKNRIIRLRERFLKSTPSERLTMKMLTNDDWELLSKPYAGEPKGQYDAWADDYEEALRGVHALMSGEAEPTTSAPASDDAKQKRWLGILDKELP